MLGAVFGSEDSNLSSPLPAARYRPQLTVCAGLSSRTTVFSDAGERIMSLGVSEPEAVNRSRNALMPLGSWGTSSFTMNRTDTLGWSRMF